MGSQPETWAFVFWFWQSLWRRPCPLRLGPPLNDMPQVGDQVQTSTLAFADHGAEIASCNCDGCDHAYWDSDRATPRDFSKTQCFDQCVTESKCKFALYDSEVPRIPGSYKENAVLDRTAGVQVTRKCWLYE